MAALNAAAPRITDRLCDACAEHFAASGRTWTRSACRIGWSPALVRGLDYYTRTAFEFYVAGREGQQQALGGGGRYDGLVELLGGRPTPGIGFGIGLDRLVLALDGDRRRRAAPEPARVAVVVGADPDDTVEPAADRDGPARGGHPARAELGRRKLGKQLEARRPRAAPTSR